MDISISSHAAEKALERGIPEESIKAILSGGSTVTLPSKTDPEAAIVFGKHADKNVITVRRASKQERRFYEQEIGN